MHSLGIHNGEQLRACSQAMLLREFGKVGALYYDCVRGIDLRPVEAVRIRKFHWLANIPWRRIFRNAHRFIIELYHVAVELVGRLEHNDFKGNTCDVENQIP